MKDVVEDLSSPNKVLVLENLSPSSNTNHAFSSNEYILAPTSTADLSVVEELPNDQICHDEYNKSHSENNENMEKVEDDTSLKTEVTVSVDSFSSSNICSDVTSNDFTGEQTEFTKNLSVENPENSLECRMEVIDNMVDESSQSPKVLSGENYMINSTVDGYLDIHDHDDKPLLLTTGSSSKEEASYCSNEQLDKVDNNVDDFSLSPEMTVMDDQSSDLNIDKGLEHEESNYKLIKYSEELSLAEKVARFIQNGDLEMIDGKLHRLLILECQHKFLYGCCR